MPGETRSQLQLPVPGFLCTSPVPTLTAQTIKINWHNICNGLIYWRIEMCVNLALNMSLHCSPSWESSDWQRCVNDRNMPVEAGKHLPFGEPCVHWRIASPRRALNTSGGITSCTVPCCCLQLIHFVVRSNVWRSNPVFHKLFLVFSTLLSHAVPS